MWAKIVAFFMAIIAFISSLFGGGGNTSKRTFTDVDYGAHAQQKLDLYLPPNNGDNLGLFVFIHGGAWLEGDKSSDAQTCKDIAKNFGYVTTSINYRMFTYPTAENTAEQMLADPNSLDAYDMMDDITAAITVAVNKAAENGCRVTNACLIGYSAGGHLALLYAYGYRQNAPVNIPFCVSYVGPADLTDPVFYFNTPAGGIGDDLALYLGSRLCHKTVNAANFYDADVQAALQTVSPLYLTSTAVPSLLFYGARDILVPIGGARRLTAALTAQGVRNDYLEFPNSGHGLEHEADKPIADQIYTLLVTYARDYFGY